MELTEKDIKTLLAKLPQLKTEIQKVIVGQDHILDELLVAFLAGGHCLLEGVPGLAKTLIVKRCHRRCSLHSDVYNLLPT
ncbi:MAG: AAA family ATPase [Mucilaginibacter sp.]